MKQILIISGKGGTGKTVLAASIAVLAKNKVMADCDVDAADLHLLLQPSIKEKFIFKGMPKVTVDQTRCTGCGDCIGICEYEAIARDSEDNSKVKIDPISCEGCQVCTHICPVDAINIYDNAAGEWYISETKYGSMIHAKLGIAEENSGKLVSVVRQKATKIAQEKHCDYVIIDGPPGIGCPVIASLSGVDLALVVTEPTLSGIHDMERVIGLARHFNVKAACVVNKFDINPVNTQNIFDWCKANKISVFGKIMYDSSVPESIARGIPVVEYADNAVTGAIRDIWSRLA
jgi:MinD superfamily P-loop ATPase